MLSRSPNLPLVLLLLALCSPARAQPAPEYGIKQNSAEVGSSIRRHAVRSSNVAVNLAYHQLPEADRQAVHAQYESMASGDEPPFPIGGLRAVLDPIRKAQEHLLAKGNLFLSATIGPDGQAQSVTVYGSPGPEMTRFAAQILMLVTYKPAVCGGRPCRMEFPLYLDFNVE